MLFQTTDYSVAHLVGAIDRGDLALPDIQRPFVWKATKVRSLFDSMYKGFPVGFLLFWETDAEPGARKISTGEAVPRNLIVDGQQRLTSLYAVLKGLEVLRENYETTRIRIAFRPSDGRFEVTDAAIESNPEYLPDISVVWTASSFHQTVREFLDRLSQRREVSQEERDRLSEALDRLRRLDAYSFKVVVLDRSIDEEQVAEIFVRINSEGVTLNQADFILTLMSVFWEKGRRDLEEFCRSARQPSMDTTAFNWYLRPQPDQMLRVSVALAFRRAVLKQVYQLLRGKGGAGGSRDEQFAQLEATQSHVLDLDNWHRFLKCLERAGFRGTKMISSDNAILFSYAMWLFGRTRFDVPETRLRALIARWFFMAHTTARYSGTVETRAERDFALLNGIAEGDAEAFEAALNDVIDATLTNDYWGIRLPNELATSASKSPTLAAYLAALNIHDAPVLFSRTSVRSVLDPTVTSRTGIRRDYLFPKQHLKTALQITGAGQVNQIANMTLMARTNSSSENDPARYWPSEVEASGLSPDEVAHQQQLHALPDGWHTMPYEEFLSARRKGMAEVIRTAFALLSDPDYTPDYPSPTGRPVVFPRPVYYGVSLADLIEHGLLETGTILVDPRQDDTTAVLRSNGELEIEGFPEPFSSPTGAATAAGGRMNGWEFWYVEFDGALVPISKVREEYVNQTGRAQPEG